MNDCDEQVCVDDYPEHDYRVIDERDGFRTYACRRCDAETWEEVPESAIAPSSETRASA